jgi:hypothetical protein
MNRVMMADAGPAEYCASTSSSVQRRPLSSKIAAAYAAGTVALESSSVPSMSKTIASTGTRRSYRASKSRGSNSSGVILRNAGMQRSRTRFYLWVVGTLLDRLASKAGADETDFISVVVAISRIPYGRPSELTANGVLDDWRGTCSTKHLLLAEIAREGWPETALSLCHRVYRVTRGFAEHRWGSRVAELVPDDGLMDVHTFALVHSGDRTLTVDVTFPISRWNGAHEMGLACGPGDDYPVGTDVLASKAELVERWCDPAVREPFIAALARASAESRDIA